MRQRNHKNLFLSVNCSPTSRQLNGPGKLLNVPEHHLSLCKNVYKAFLKELLEILQSYICESDNPVTGNNRYLYISLELNNSITSNLVTKKAHIYYFNSFCGQGFKHSLAGSSAAGSHKAATICWPGQQFHLKAGLSKEPLSSSHGCQQNSVVAVVGLKKLEITGYWWRILSSQRPPSVLSLVSYPKKVICFIKPARGESSYVL